ncbi:toxin-antitoxin system TumE family protein [Aerosakkonema funiforme]|uniref:toxin-antitoxin system TumE family protein n=1 Tax=Aerosakkonema funiforme TaxID=1246630 RepID=UPI0035BC785B
METQQYLNEIKAKLAASLAVASVTIVKERALLSQGYFRARLTLSNGDFLEVVEFFVLRDRTCVTESYRYQWMDNSQKVLRKRWDNVCPISRITFMCARNLMLKQVSR